MSAAAKKKSSEVPRSQSTKTLKTLSEEEWKARLTPKQYGVLREKKNDRENAKADLKLPQGGEGYYVCIGCDSPLYYACNKYTSHYGLPSFTTAIRGAVIRSRDEATGHSEILCATCNGYLGHAVDNDPGSTTNVCYSTNFTAITFSKFFPSSTSSPTEDKSLSSSSYSSPSSSITERMRRMTTKSGSNGENDDNDNSGDDDGDGDDDDDDDDDDDNDDTGPETQESTSESEDEPTEGRVSKKTPQKSKSPKTKSTPKKESPKRVAGESKAKKKASPAPPQPSSSSSTSATSSPQATKWIWDSLGEQLLVKDNSTVTRASTFTVLKTMNPTYVMVYFSAHWCPPCRRFTPVLSAWYKNLSEDARKRCMLVFASNDHDEKSMMTYFESMSWSFALPQDSAHISKLSRFCEVKGIPCLALLAEEKDKTRKKTSSVRLVATNMQPGVTFETIMRLVTHPS